MENGSGKFLIDRDRDEKSNEPLCMFIVRVIKGKKVCISH